MEGEEEHQTQRSEVSYLINGGLNSPAQSSFSDPTPRKHSDLLDHLQIIREVYNRHLSSIEKNLGLSESQKAKKKVVALEAYIKSLHEQNDCFASALTNLERECEQRVKEMEKRLKKSAKLTMEAVINMHDFEKDTRRVTEERKYLESLYKDVNHHLTDLKVENGFLRDQNSNLNHDVQALLHVIHHARSTGHWELDCVTFCEVTPEQVFGPIQSISHNYKAEASASSQLLRRESEKMSTSDLASVCNSSPLHSQVRHRDFWCNSSTSDSDDVEKLNVQFKKLLEERAYLDSEVSRLSIGNQTEIKKTSISTQVSQELGSAQHVSKYTKEELEKQLLAIENVKEDLYKAMIHDEQKSVLLTELQNHLNLALQDVERKDQVINVYAQRLASVDMDCDALKKKVEATNKCLEESYELIENLKTQVREQSVLIRNLQEALVQSKRALETQAVARATSKKSPRSNIVDI